eukprot:1754332-Pyramimonas_sp.AAC.1
MLAFALAVDSTIWYGSLAMPSNITSLPAESILLTLSRSAKAYVAAPPVGVAATTAHVTCRKGSISPVTCASDAEPDLPAPSTLNSPATSALVGNASKWALCVKET